VREYVESFRVTPRVARRAEERQPQPATASTLQLGGARFRRQKRVSGRTASGKVTAQLAYVELRLSDGEPRSFWIP